MDYYEKKLLQGTRLRNGSRKVIQWNTYLHQQAAIVNNGELPSFISLHAVQLILESSKHFPPGLPAIKFRNLSPEIGAKWKTLTPEEKNDATAHLIEEINNCCGTKAVGACHLPTAIFHDTHKTLTNIENEVCRYIFILHSRTNSEQ